jgi:hypothetical protein
VRTGRSLRSLLRCRIPSHSHAAAWLGQDPTDDAVFTGGRRGEVRAWNYKTGADWWQNTRLAPDPHNRRRQVVPGKDPKCTLLVYVRAQRAGAAGPSSSPPLDRHKSADVATCCLPCNFCSWRTTIPASLLRWTFARRFTPWSRATTSSTPLNLGLTLSWKRAGHPAQRQNS